MSRGYFYQDHDLSAEPIPMDLEIGDDWFNSAMRVRGEDVPCFELTCEIVPTKPFALTFRTRSSLFRIDEPNDRGIGIVRGFFASERMLGLIKERQKEMA